MALQRRDVEPGPDVSLELPAHPGAPRLARDLLRARLAGVVTPAQLQDALLLTTELVTNAVLHGEPPISLTVDIEGAPPVARVSVTDCHRQSPQMQASDQDAIAGRGIAVVDALAWRWGIRRLPDGGKTIWFEIALGAGADAGAVAGS